MKRTRVPTPTLDRILELKDQSQVIGEFVEWLLYHPKLVLKDDYGHEVHDIEKLLAMYFDIDLNEAERERMAVLRDVREDNKVQATMKRLKG